MSANILHLFGALSPSKSLFREKRMVFKEKLGDSAETDPVSPSSATDSIKETKKALDGLPKVDFKDLNIAEILKYYTPEEKKSPEFTKTVIMFASNYGGFTKDIKEKLGVSWQVTENIVSILGDSVKTELSKDAHKEFVQKIQDGKIKKLSYQVKKEKDLMTVVVSGGGEKVECKVESALLEKYEEKVAAVKDKTKAATAVVATAVAATITPAAGETGSPAPAPAASPELVTDPAKKLEQLSSQFNSLNSGGFFRETFTISADLQKLMDTETTTRRGVKMKFDRFLQEFRDTDAYLTISKQLNQGFRITNENQVASFIQHTLEIGVNKNVSFEDLLLAYKKVGTGAEANWLERFFTGSDRVFLNQLEEKIKQAKTESSPEKKAKLIQEIEKGIKMMEAGKNIINTLRNAKVTKRESFSNTGLHQEEIRNAQEASEGETLHGSYYSFNSIVAYQDLTDSSTREQSNWHGQTEIKKPNDIGFGVSTKAYENFATIYKDTVKKDLPANCEDYILRTILRFEGRNLAKLFKNGNIKKDKTTGNLLLTSIPENFAKSYYKDVLLRSFDRDFIQSSNESRWREVHQRLESLVYSNNGNYMGARESLIRSLSELLEERDIRAVYETSMQSAANDSRSDRRRSIDRFNRYTLEAMADKILSMDPSVIDPETGAVDDKKIHEILKKLLKAGIEAERQGLVNDETNRLPGLIDGDDVEVESKNKALEAFMKEQSVENWNKIDGHQWVDNILKELGYSDNKKMADISYKILKHEIEEEYATSESAISPTLPRNVDINTIFEVVLANDSEKVKKVKETYGSLKPDKLRDKYEELVKANKRDDILVLFVNSCARLTNRFGKLGTKYYEEGSNVENTYLNMLTREQAGLIARGVESDERRGAVEQMAELEKYLSKDTLIRSLQNKLIAQGEVASAIELGRYIAEHPEKLAEVKKQLEEKMAALEKQLKAYQEARAQGKTVALAGAAFDTGGHFTGAGLGLTYVDLGEGWMFDVGAVAISPDAIHWGAGPVINVRKKINENHQISVGTAAIISGESLSPTVNLGYAYTARCGTIDIPIMAGVIINPTAWDEIDPLKMITVGAGVAVIGNEGRMIEQREQEIAKKWLDYDKKIKAAPTAKEKAAIIREFLNQPGTDSFMLGDQEQIKKFLADTSDAAGDLALLTWYEQTQDADHSQAVREGKFPKFALIGGALGGSLNLADITAGFTALLQGQGLGEAAKLMVKNFLLMGGIILKVGDKIIIRYQTENGPVIAEAVAEGQLNAALSKIDLSKLQPVDNNYSIMLNGRRAVLESAESQNLNLPGNATYIDTKNKTTVDSLPADADLGNYRKVLRVRAMNGRERSSAQNVRAYIDPALTGVRAIVDRNGDLLIDGNHEGLFVLNMTFQYPMPLTTQGGTAEKLIVITKNPNFKTQNIIDNSGSFMEIGYRHNRFESPEIRNNPGSSGSGSFQMLENMTTENLNTLTGYNGLTGPEGTRVSNARKLIRENSNVLAAGTEGEIRKNFNTILENLWKSASDGGLDLGKKLKSGNPKITERDKVLKVVNDFLATTGQSPLSAAEENQLYLYVDNQYFVELWDNGNINQVKAEFDRNNNYLEKLFRDEFAKVIKKNKSAYGVSTDAEAEAYAGKLAGIVKQKSREKFLEKLAKIDAVLKKAKSEGKKINLLQAAQEAGLPNLGNYIFEIGTTHRSVHQRTLVEETVSPTSNPVAMGVSTISLLTELNDWSTDTSPEGKNIARVIYEMMNPSLSESMDNIVEVLESPVAQRLALFEEATVSEIGVANYERLADYYKTKKVSDYNKEGIKAFADFMETKIKPALINHAGDKPIVIKLKNGNELYIKNAKLVSGNYAVCGNQLVGMAQLEFVLKTPSAIYQQTAQEVHVTNIEEVDSFHINLILGLKPEVEGGGGGGGGGDKNPDDSNVGTTGADGDETGEATAPSAGGNPDQPPILE